MIKAITTGLTAIVFFSVILTSMPAQAIGPKGERFVAEVRADWARQRTNTPENIVSAGKDICNVIDEGNTAGQLIRYMKREAGIRPKKMRQFIRTSADYYCPWNASVV